MENKTLRLILGDQLNCNHSWFERTDNSITYVMMEIRTETDYAINHIQKITGFFAAMRHFSNFLKAKNNQCIYLEINDKDNLQSLQTNLSFIIERDHYTRFEYLLPDEYRVDAVLQKFTSELAIVSKVYDTEHFFSSRDELGKFFEGKKTFLMESFYRAMRKKHHVLMSGDNPLTGQWNYDQENRKKLPKNHKPTTPLVFNNDVSPIVDPLYRTILKRSDLLTKQILFGL